MKSGSATCRSLLRVNVTRAIRVLGASLGLLLLSLPVFSQTNQGTIQGSVFDQSGGAIAGATVTIVDVARGVSRLLTSDAAGAFLAGNLIPGMYTVRGEAKGFETLERSNILLEVGQTVRVDLVLQPGAQTQTITVTGEAPSIDTSDAVLGGNISNDTLVSLPMNGRDFKNFMSLRPGISTIAGGGIDTWAANGNAGRGRRLPGGRPARGRGVYGTKPDEFQHPFGRLFDGVASGRHPGDQ